MKQEHGEVAPDQDKYEFETAFQGFDELSDSEWDLLEGRLSAAAHPGLLGDLKPFRELIAHLDLGNSEESYEWAFTVVSALNPSVNAPEGWEQALSDQAQARLFQLQARYSAIVGRAWAVESRGPLDWTIVDVVQSVHRLGSTPREKIRVSIGRLNAETIELQCSVPSLLRLVRSVLSHLRDFDDVTYDTAAVDELRDIAAVASEITQSQTTT